MLSCDSRLIQTLLPLDPVLGNNPLDPSVMLHNVVRAARPATKPINLRKFFRKGNILLPDFIKICFRIKIVICDISEKVILIVLLDLILKSYKSNHLIRYKMHSIIKCNDILSDCEQTAKMARPEQKFPIIPASL